jgi:hypothetical protein
MWFQTRSILPASWLYATMQKVLVQADSAVPLVAAEQP